MSEVQEAAMGDGKREFIDGLRQMADHLAACRYDDRYTFGGLTFNVTTWSEDEFRDAGRHIGGFREKCFEGSYAIQRLRFGPHKIDVIVGREVVCEKVQIGERVIPAQPAQEERVEPIYDWRCEGFEAA